MTRLIIDVDEHPNFAGQELGRELELELTAVVTRAMPEGGIPSGEIELLVVRADIVQTT